MALRILGAVVVLTGLMCLVGCETVPQHVVPEAYPASGPTGIRMGLTYQHNFRAEHFFPYWDASDFWKDSWGGTVEIPVDVSPYFGGYFGVGYEHYKGESGTVELPGGTKEPAKMDSINLLPIYVGVVGRYPFWLDQEKWEKAVDTVWLPEPPVGFAPYARGAFGGAILLNSPDIVYKRTGKDWRAFDYQLFPFLEGALGLEYRNEGIGYWAEVGYRFYILSNRARGGFGGSDRMAHMGGVRAQAGITIYFP